MDKILKRRRKAEGSAKWSHPLICVCCPFLPSLSFSPSLSFLPLYGTALYDPPPIPLLSFSLFSPLLLRFSSVSFAEWMIALFVICHLSSEIILLVQVFDFLCWFFLLFGYQSINCTINLTRKTLPHNVDSEPALRSSECPTGQIALERRSPHCPHANGWSVPESDFSLSI